MSGWIGIRRKYAVAAVLWAVLTSLVGSACRVDFTGPCDPNPCENDGICSRVNDSAVCDCISGFTGERCETNIDDCVGTPCQNGGTCIDLVNAFTCDCAPGFSGPACETNDDNCDPNPCRYGGTCIDGDNQFSCECLEGWTGPTCAEEACVSQELIPVSCTSSATEIAANHCDVWTDGDSESRTELCCGPGSPAESFCVPDGTAGCTTADGCVLDLWVGVDLGTPQLATRVRFLGDWWTKTPDVYEVWTSNDASDVPDGGATLVATGAGNPRPWQCETGDSCLPETVPEVCCPDGREAPQDTTTAGDMYPRYDILDLPPTEGRFWYLMVRSTQYPKCISFREITFIARSCSD